MLVQRSAKEFLDRDIGHLWPKAADANGFKWDLLVDPQNRSGHGRLDFQFFRANIDPSERYVLSVPKSTRYRLHAGESGFDNLYLAGDWTRTGLNVGCVEAAVMSGMQAARALSGYPRTVAGETDE